MHICSLKYTLCSMTTHSNFFYYTIGSHKMYTFILFVVILVDYLDYKLAVVVGFKKYIFKKGFELHVGTWISGSSHDY
jgi:hypothetical protein